MNNRNLEDVADEYTQRLVDEFEQRVQSWNLNFDEEEKFTVSAGLLCRQMTLSICVARDTALWNWDLGMMVIRMMASVHIDLAWITLDAQTRAKLFIEYGTGQGLLDLEHKRLFAEKGDVDKDSLELAENWLASQRKEMFTEVNLASWSGLTVSKMAEEANCIDIYEGFYVPACSPLHSNWFHLSRGFVSAEQTSNGTKWVPACPEYGIYPDIFSLAARLASRTLATVDTTFPEGTRPKQCSFEWLRQTLKEEPTQS